jgi:hypothetical protein
LNNPVSGSRRAWSTASASQARRRQMSGQAAAQPATAATTAVAIKPWNADT